MKYNIDLLVRYKNLEVQSKEEALEQIIKDFTEYEAPCERDTLSHLAERPSWFWMRGSATPVKGTPADCE